jgi:hypothetical protein
VKGIVIANTLAYHKKDVLLTLKCSMALCVALWEIIHEKKFDASFIVNVENFQRVTL